MKRLLVLFTIMVIIFSGCTERKNNESKSITPVGSVPEEFKQIIDENVFYQAVAFENRLLKSTSTEDEQVVEMYNFDGELLASCERITDLYMTSMITTSDGGFLFVLGFEDSVSEDGIWKSDNGVYSTIVKCDSEGNISWEKTLENYTGAMLQYCIETENCYYFFGEQETPETKTVGVWSPTDIHILKMDKDGNVSDTEIIGGSDYDSLYQVKKQEDTFILYCRSQSVDGDFSESGDWEVIIDSELTLVSQKKTEYEFVDYLGIKDGNIIYSNDKIFEDFTDGVPTAVLDYGDFYIIVSENVTGRYENQPAIISSMWYYTETVYGAYDKNGDLLWKYAVDSSPDYDAMVSEFEE